MIAIVPAAVWFSLIRYIPSTVEAAFRATTVVILNVLPIFFIKAGARRARYSCFKSARKSTLPISSKESSIFLSSFLTVREVFKMVMPIIALVNWGLSTNFLNPFAHFSPLLSALANCFCHSGINLSKDTETEELVLLNFDKEPDIGLPSTSVTSLSLIRKPLPLPFNVVVRRCEKSILFFNSAVNIPSGILTKICPSLVTNRKTSDMKFSFWLALIYLI